MKTKFAIGVLLFAALAVGQGTKPAARNPVPSGNASTKSEAARKPADAAKPAGNTAAPGLPSRATAESFLQHAFGWDPQLKLTLKDVKWSPAATVAEIDVHAETPKGPVESAIYVTSDHKNTIAGQMFPFGGQPGLKPTEAQVNAFVKQITANSPGLTWTVLEVKPNALDNLTEVTVVLTNAQGQRGAQRFWVTPDGQHVLLGENGPFGADPFAAARAELTKGINGPSKGPATAPILLVEFGDLECPSCKAAVPIVERLLKEVPNSRLVFQQFPLTQIHHWAYKAAQFGDCIARQNNGAYWKFMDAVYGAQEDISGHVESSDPNKKPDLNYAEQKLTELAGQSGMNGKQIAACAVDPATSARVDRSMELGKHMQVTGTPTLFINGRRIQTLGSMPYDALKRLVEFMGSPAAR
jgi:protein-disulfide isomerase